MSVNMMWTVEELNKMRACKRRYLRGIFTYEEALIGIGQILGMLPNVFSQFVTIPDQMLPELEVIYAAI